MIWIFETFYCSPILGGRLSAHIVIDTGKGVLLSDNCIYIPHKVVAFFFLMPWKEFNFIMAKPLTVIL